MSFSTTTTTTFSRLLSLSTALTTTTPKLHHHHFLHSSFTPKPTSLKLTPHKPPSISTTIATTTTISATATTTTTPITVGSKLPNTTLSYLDSTNELQTTTISALTTSKKTILFAVPGAFTPTCSQKHLPSFIQYSRDLKSKGVDVIACISVNDAFVMKAWKESLNVVDDEVLLLSDGNGDFTRAIGAELDLRDKPVGLGVRSRRYAMLVEDGVVKVLNMEDGGAFTFSGAEDMLKVL